MTKMVFSFYLLIAISFAFFAVETKVIDVPFDYQYEFSSREIMPYIFYLVTGWFFYLIGYFFSGKKEIQEQKNVDSVDYFNGFNNSGVSNKLFYLCIFAQIVIFLYILYGLNEMATLTSDSYDKEFRPLGGKFTNIILIIQALIAIIFYSNRFFHGFLVLICLTVSLLFSWIDASRSAVLPIAVLLLYAISNKKFITSFFYFVIGVFLFVMAMVARGYAQRANFDSLCSIISFTFDSYFELINSFVGYLFSFSVLQFSLVVRDNAGEFNVNDLIYSILPIPSFLWPYEPDYSLWRVDFFRPMGALSEILRVSIFAFYIFFAFLGWLSKKVDGIKSAFIRVLSLSVFLLIVVQLFQYNLRTTEWFIYLLLFFVFIDKKISRKNPNLGSI